MKQEGKDSHGSGDCTTSTESQKKYDYLQDFPGALFAGQWQA
jgi:hypothetical protein